MQLITTINTPEIHELVLFHWHAGCIPLFSHGDCKQKPIKVSGVSQIAPSLWNEEFITFSHLYNLVLLITSKDSHWFVLLFFLSICCL